MGRDGDLVKRVLDGDRSAAEELVLRHVGAVRTSIIAQMGRYSDVDDLAQETLLRGLRDLASVREPDRVGAWFRGIARHLCHDAIRRKSRQPVTLGDMDEWIVASDPESSPDLSPVQTAVLALPPKLREAILLFYVQRESYAEIGERLGVTSAAVNRRLTRARHMLRERLQVGREEGTDGR